jgi:hypothetical protein
MLCVFYIQIILIPWLILHFVAAKRRCGQNSSTVTRGETQKPGTQALRGNLDTSVES